MVVEISRFFAVWALVVLVGGWVVTRVLGRVCVVVDWMRRRRKGRKGSFAGYKYGDVLYHGTVP